MNVHTGTETLESHRCGGCGIWFAMPDWYVEERKRDRKGFNCPNGCSRIFTGQTREQKLKSEVARLKDRVVEERQRKQDAKRSLSATKGVVTRMKNRAAAGLCPCCNRTFQNLARHMKNQHPEYAKQEDH